MYLYGRYNYSQEHNGNDHHKPEGPGTGPGADPPEKVLERLKEKTGWDWKEKRQNRENILRNTEVLFTDIGWVIVYQDGTQYALGGGIP